MTVASVLILTTIATAQEPSAGPSKGQEMQRISFDDTLGWRLFPTSRGPSGKWSKDGKAYSFRGAWFDLETGKKIKAPDPQKSKPIDKFAETNSAAALVFFSPDKKWRSEVRDWNLFVTSTEMAAAERVAISSDGNKELLYGILDWVYQEEVYGRHDFRGHWWSPDSKKIAFLKIDEEPVGEFTVVDHIPVTLKTEITNYPKAGYPNPRAELGIYDLETKKTIWCDLSHYEGQEPLVVKVGWTPDSSKVVFQMQNRIQNKLDLNYADPATGTVTRLIHEESKAWVNVLGDPHWLDDGSFLWLSERSGYKHVYHYQGDGKLKRALTSGPWEVKDILAVDEKSRRLFFTGSRESAIAVDAYRVGLNWDADGKDLVRLTPDRGKHRVKLNADHTHLIDHFSSLAAPPRVVLRDLDGKIVRDLGSVELEASHHYEMPQSHTIKTRDGFEMDATVIMPHAFDASKKYPVMLLTYSGPNAPSVGDDWNGSVWHQFLAQEGIIVLQVNNRSSSQKGQVSTETCYKNFGEQELNDLLDAVSWLCKNSWADADRVGISGWSYGGFMAAYALCRSKSFALGLAGAGVYSWRLYDTIYTERYMSTPQLNPEGYKNASPMTFAKDLHGHLVMMHGTMDDNVHLQNSIQFIFELQKAGKQFDFMVYPKQRHGVREPALRRHLQQLKWNAIQKHLLGT